MKAEEKYEQLFSKMSIVSWMELWLVLAPSKTFWASLVRMVMVLY